jgi:cytochrome c-type biogenesis protein CcmH
MKKFVVLWIGLVLGAGPAAIGAQKPAAVDSALDARTRQLASQLRCPVCQGLSIQDSPSDLAQQMRDVVRQQLDDGQSPDDVKRYFVARYGEWILMEPPAAGFNWIVYALPGLVLLGGALVLARSVRRWTTAPKVSEASDAR